MLNLGLEFFSLILLKLKEEVKVHTHKCKLDQYYPDTDKKIPLVEGKTYDQSEKLKMNPNLKDFWQEDGIMVDYEMLLCERIVMLMIDLVAGKNEATVSQIKKLFTVA